MHTYSIKSTLIILNTLHVNTSNVIFFFWGFHYSDHIWAKAFPYLSEILCLFNPFLLLWTFSMQTHNLIGTHRVSSHRALHNLQVWAATSKSLGCRNERTWSANWRRKRKPRHICHCAMPKHYMNATTTIFHRTGTSHGTFSYVVMWLFW